jgi:hypothetical protein
MYYNTMRKLQCFGGSHSGDYEADCILECDPVKSQKFYNFHKNVLPSSPGFPNKPSRKRYYSVYCFTLKMEAVNSSIMSVNFYQISHCHILEDNIL